MTPKTKKKIFAMNTVQNAIVRRKSIRYNQYRFSNCPLGSLLTGNKFHILKEVSP